MGRLYCPVWNVQECEAAERAVNLKATLPILMKQQQEYYDAMIAVRGFGIDSGKMTNRVLKGKCKAAELHIKGNENGLNGYLPFHEVGKIPCI